MSVEQILDGLYIRIIQMIIIGLEVVKSCISWVWGVVVLPANIHETGQHKPTTNHQKNPLPVKEVTYFVTNTPLRARRLLRPP